LRIIFFFIIALTFLNKSLGQSTDSVFSKSDSILSVDSLSVNRELSSVEKIISRNSILNTKDAAQSNISKPRKSGSINGLFYVVLFLIFFLAIVKTLYDRYFSNLLKVFFQTSLRQSQLTDQLMNAGLPSLLMNIFFILTGALYITLLSGDFAKQLSFEWKVFGITAIALTAIYLIKYLTIQLAGWITGYQKEAESYSFIVFLVNKMLAISILPLLIFMTFAEFNIAKAAVYLSYVIIAVIFFSRFFRSLSVLQHRFRLNRLHFFLYIVGVELLPIFLICKIAFKIFSKYL
jgi:hypothetical protein